ncbi:putative endonuclease [Pseudomonas phage vB_PsyM_KIL4]|nr:homing endonuclease [Pseudomonas phage vB_PsyM_KIL4]AMR57788.1 putative endonuclease [Pseudomonas phage vB_PsyM_KIL4]AMR57957.1 putative endonuclease [Pseudomonas phage vB_PsyM_KIL5]
MINYLYKITNKVNGKTYIGITRDPDSRRKQHLVWKRQSSNSILKLAIDKYGKDAFEFEILVAGDLSYIKDLEIKAILAYDSLAGIGHGYNIHSGGGHNNGGE